MFISLSIVLERMQYEVRLASYWLIMMILASDWLTMIMLTSDWLQGVVDVFQTVRTLRTQRPAMVQTEVGVINTGA